jgi:hypothetical protein
MQRHAQIRQRRDRENHRQQKVDSQKPASSRGHFRGSSERANGAEVLNEIKSGAEFGKRA